MNDYELITELVNSPTSLADEVGLPCPRVATDDDPDDSLDSAEEIRFRRPRRVRPHLPRGACLCGDE